MGVALKVVFLLSLSLLGMIAAFSYLPPLFLRRRQARMLKGAFTGCVALTFDDGPDDKTTPLLLDVLKGHRVQATFFVVGFRAERHPEVCDRIVAEGHEVGCHSYWHRNFWRKAPWTGVADITQAYRALARWVPADGPYRPPRGKLTGWQWLALRRRGSVLLWWTHTVGDTLDPLPSVSDACGRVVECNGGVLLIHCHHKEPHRREFVLSFVDQLLKLLSAKGIPVVPLIATIESNGTAPDRAVVCPAGEP